LREGELADEVNSKEYKAGIYSAVIFIYIGLD
jgi:hypothetical protein